ncbi:hypothetical protein SLA2020_338300 [Shorea laevis]
MGSMATGGGEWKNFLEAFQAPSFTAQGGPGRGSFSSTKARGPLLYGGDRGAAPPAASKPVYGKCVYPRTQSQRIPSQNGNASTSRDTRPVFPHLASESISAGNSPTDSNLCNNILVVTPSQCNAFQEHVHMKW